MPSPLKRAPGPWVVFAPVLILGLAFAVLLSAHPSQGLAGERLPLIGAKKAAQARALEEDVDRLSLAALLLKDGYADRALVALAEVDPTAPGLDRLRFHTLRGLAHSKVGSYQEAAEDFEVALAIGGAEPELHLYLARARLALKDYSAALASTDAALAEDVDRPGIWLLRFHAHRALGMGASAYEDLAVGAQRFPEESPLLKQQAFYLVELGLYQGAREVGVPYLALAEENEGEAYVALSEALTRSGNIEEAQRLLEGARLRFPGDITLTLQLAQSYIKGANPLAAAEVMVQAAAEDPTLMVEAAELFRRAGALERALFYNGLVEDPAQKAKQRLGFLLELGAFDRAAALAPRLRRLGLLEEDALLYALAYAHFMLGDYDQAEAALLGIEDPSIFKMATQLREAMQTCRQDALACL